MANFKRRFTKEEFKKEMFTHLKDIPPGHLKNPKKLEESAEYKASHYSEALKALDAAAARIRKMAEASQDANAKTEADAAIKEINDAINAYGEAAMSGNSTWQHNATE